MVSMNNITNTRINCLVIRVVGKTYDEVMEMLGEQIAANSELPNEVICVDIHPLGRQVVGTAVIDTTYIDRVAASFVVADRFEETLSIA